jgi:two-component system KDP operon response regulator KdpE
MAALDGDPLQLTAKEFELLAYLARHAGKVCTHHMILKDVWGPGYGEESNYVRVYTHRLRKKLGDEEGRLLKTVPGIGYQLTAEPSADHPLPATNS